MSRYLAIAIAQVAPRPHDDPLDAFEAEVHSIAATLPLTQLKSSGPPRLVIYPEEHVCGVTASTPVERERAWRELAEPLSGGRVDRLCRIARDAQVWLVPGSVIEAGPNGELWNTSPLISPTGEIVARYRKIFPFRPVEPFTSGDEFVVHHIPEVGHIGLSICYDAWFPEVSRQLSWMGAELIINVAQTDGSDCAQEAVLARANAIVNQVYVVRCNSAAPLGAGRSMIVDPEGIIRSEAAGETATLLTDVIDLDQVDKVRRFGVAALGRPWAQYTDPGPWTHPRPDPVIELPVYDGRINPSSWAPGSRGTEAKDQGDTRVD